jgi:tRNA(Ile2) C34 agmatinyltransferase TiaS
MKTVDMLPGESNASIISSIINLVCPQCGGKMSEFECEGRCGRNWLAEWEWANHPREAQPGTRVQVARPRH